jgi:G protein-coupled receptor GPR1
MAVATPSPFSPDQLLTIQLIALVFSIISVLSAFLAFYWFRRMRRTFRHEYVLPSCKPC